MIFGSRERVAAMIRVLIHLSAYGRGSSAGDTGAGTRETINSGNQLGHSTYTDERRELTAATKSQPCRNGAPPGADGYRAQRAVRVETCQVLQSSYKVGPAVHIGVSRLSCYERAQT